ncbi:response regulator [Marinomonas balearica]|uniref:Response regulator receiver domain-containing protein n=1 Tax=Marinomonas balearica TaxID=491947 RepID=A0A4R6M2M6_9GAMM|nr:response regulator [Marinomonas balearica]TDO95507.1 response regulator receiver domain-containing protein [Marinomonas balearica]
MQNILLVDDEAQILMALKRVLRKQNYNVITAEGGDEALAVLNDTPIDLILSDYMMPGLSGTDFLEKAEALQPDSIRMILSGHSDFESVMESLKSGIVHKYLVKPWHNDELIDQINQSLLDKQASDSELEEDFDDLEVLDVASLASPFMMIESTLEHEIVSIDEKLAESLGYSVDELQGKLLQKLFADRSFQQHLSFLGNQDTSAKSWSVPTQTRIAQTSQDTFFPVKLSLKKQGETLQYSIEIIEMNTLHNEDLKKRLKVIEGAYIVVDRKGKVIRCNQKMRGMLEGVMAVQVGTTLSEWFADLRFQELCKGLELDNERELKLAFKGLDNGLTVISCDLNTKKLKNTQEVMLSDAQRSINSEMVEFMKETVLSPLSDLAMTELTEGQKQQLSKVTEACNRMLTAINNIACRE